MGPRVRTDIALGSTLKRGKREGVCMFVCVCLSRLDKGIRRRYGPGRTTENVAVYVLTHVCVCTLKQIASCRDKM